MCRAFNVSRSHIGFFCSKETFSPGNLAPFNGYMRKIDDESKLKNIIFPNQRATQSKFIPSSTSDLYFNKSRQLNILFNQRYFEYVLC